MNVYKIELFFADEYSHDSPNFLEDIKNKLLDYSDDDEKVFVKITSCKMQDIDAEDAIFQNFDESKAVNLLVK